MIQIDQHLEKEGVPSQYLLINPCPLDLVHLPKRCTCLGRAACLRAPGSTPSKGQCNEALGGAGRQEGVWPILVPGPGRLGQAGQSVGLGGDRCQRHHLLHGISSLQ